MKGEKLQITKAGLKTMKKLAWRPTFRREPHAKYDLLHDLAKGSRTEQKLLNPFELPKKDLSQEYMVLYQKVLGDLIKSGDIVRSISRKPIKTTTALSPGLSKRRFPRITPKTPKLK